MKSILDESVFYQFNTECHKVLSGMFDRHETIADMDTCRAVDMKIPKIVMDGLSRLWTGTRSAVEPKMDILTFV